MTDQSAPVPFLRALFETEEEWEAFLATPDGPFVPTSRYVPGLDMLWYLTTDCSYTSERVDGTFALLRDNATGQVVGFEVWGFTDVVRTANAPA